MVFSKAGIGAKQSNQGATSISLCWGFSSWTSRTQQLVNFLLWGAQEYRLGARQPPGFFSERWNAMFFWVTRSCQHLLSCTIRALLHGPGDRTAKSSMPSTHRDRTGSNWITTGMSLGLSWAGPDRSPRNSLLCLSTSSCVTESVFLSLPPNTHFWFSRWELLWLSASFL